MHFLLLFLPPNVFFKHTKHIALLLQKSISVPKTLPNTQPLPRTLHLYSSTLFYLLKGNHPNPSLFDKSALDKDIMTLWK